MRQRIYREDQPDQAYEDPPEGFNGVWADLFLWVCDKVFSRADNRNKHEAAHSNSLTCGVCGQYFNRMDSLARRCAQHETPEAKQRLPMKRPVAPEPGPSPKQRRTVSPPPRTPMENPVGPDVLPEDPETRALHRQHWQSIRTGDRQPYTGAVQHYTP